MEENRGERDLTKEERDLVRLYTERLQARFDNVNGELRRTIEDRNSWRRLALINLGVKKEDIPYIENATVGSQIGTALTGIGC